MKFDADASRFATIMTSVEVRETLFGPIVREVGAQAPSDPVLRAGLRLVGGVLIFFALAVWISPGAALAGDLVAMKLGATLTALALAAILVGASSEPEVPEVQFDTRRREVRFARRGGEGPSRLTASFAMDHVMGITVEPVVEGSEHCHMALTIDGVDHGLLVVSGLRAELLPVAARLRRDMRPLSRRIADRMVSRAA